ncbi:MAG: PorV/PorQ family protein [bacterium]|nr:PorV/PorQ family protein [bacterium]
MKNKLLLLLCLILAFTAQLAYSWELNTETEIGEAGEAAPYLKTGVGPRALAMGSAFIAVADDNSGSYWNPAGIPFIKQNQVGLVYSKMSLDRSYNYASVILPSWKLGISAIMSGVDDIDGYDIHDYATGSFKESNTVLLLSYAPKLADDISLGLNLKLLQSKIKDTSGTGYGLDLGTMFILTEKLRAALVLQDLYTSINWKGDYSEKAATVAKVGTSYDIFESGSRSYNVKLSVDAEKYATRKRVRYNFGTEFSLPYNLSLRAGMADNFLTAGFGLKMGFLGLDYCYKVDKLKMEDTNQIALNLYWGGNDYDTYSSPAPAPAPVKKK